MPVAEGQVGAEASTVGEHPRHRTMPADGSSSPTDVERPDAADERGRRGLRGEGAAARSSATAAWSSIPSRERNGARSSIATCATRSSPRTAPYPEKEVNQRLALFHPDVATIRRGMVDAGLVTRAAGEYRRGS